jgi:hypothetical protein
MPGTSQNSVYGYKTMGPPVAARCCDICERLKVCAIYARSADFYRTNPIFPRFAKAQLFFESATVSSVVAFVCLIWARLLERKDD